MLNRKLTAYILAALRILLYPTLMAVFALIMELNNPYFLNINRTTAITMMTMVVTLVAFSKIYGGFSIGEMRQRTIAMNVCAAVLMSDIVSYLALEIMNVNDRNRRYLQLFGEDFLLLILVIAIQFVLIMGFVRVCTILFYRLNPPKKCCVVARDREAAQLILPKLRQWKEWFSEIECVMADDENVHEAIKRSDRVVLFHLSGDVHQRLIEYCYKHRKAIYFNMRIGDIIAHDARPLFMDDVLMGVHTQHGLTVKQRFIKRTMDIALSSLMLIVGSPILAACAVAIKLDDHGPVFYRQERMTRDCRIFSIYKFRTMRVENCAADRSVTGDDPRITKAGKVLRRYRLDELPQLINILKGDMSLVGPRPEMLSNVEEYTRQLPEFQYRSKVKAGLTGYAQIMGKYNTPPREKLMMDVAYIDNYSLWLDITLLFRTVIAVLRPDSTEAFQTQSDEDGKDDNDAEAV